MTAQANVVLSISSIAKTAGILAAVAAIKKLAVGAKEMIFEGEKFKKMNDNLSISISKAAAASKDQIDTMEMMRGAQKIQQAGLKITNEQFADFSKLVTSYAEKTGQDATEQFNKFSTALSRGSARALRPLGIDLKEGGGLAENFADAMKQVEERAKGATVEADDLHSTVYAFNNSFGTAKLALGAFISELSRSGGVWQAITGWIGEAKGALDMFSEIIMDRGPNFRDAVMNWGNFFKSFAATVLESIADLVDVLSDVPLIGDLFSSGASKYLRSTATSMTDELYEDFSSATAADKKLPNGGRPKPAATPALPSMPRRRGKGGKSGKSGKGIVSGPSVDDLIENYGVGREVSLPEGFGELNDLMRERNEIKKESLNLRIEEQERELSFAEEFRAVWTDSLDGVSAATLGAKSATDLLRTSWYDAIYAIVEGNKSAGQAILEAMKKIGLALAVEASLRAMFEGAQAIAAAARYDYAAAAQHGSAAGLFTALAVAGAAVAAGGTMGLKASSGSKERGASGSAGSSEGAGRSYGYAGSAGSDQGRGPVVVILQGGAEKIFEVVESENQRAAIGGRSSFAVAGG